MISSLVVAKMWINLIVSNVEWNGFTCSTFRSEISLIFVDASPLDAVIQRHTNRQWFANYVVAASIVQSKHENYHQQFLACYTWVLVFNLIRHLSEFKPTEKFQNMKEKLFHSIETNKKEWKMVRLFCLITISLLRCCLVFFFFFYRDTQFIDVQ